MDTVDRQKDKSFDPSIDERYIDRYGQIGIWKYIQIDGEKGLALTADAGLCQRL